MARQPLRIVLLLIGLAVVLAASAQATVNNYFVNNVTGSDSNDGKAATTGGGHGPWKTLNHASTSLVVGSTGTIVSVAPGTYTETQASCESGIAFCFTVGGTSNSARVAFVCSQEWVYGSSQGCLMEMQFEIADINYFDFGAIGQGFDVGGPTGMPNNQSAINVLSSASSNGISIHFLGNYFHNFGQNVSYGGIPGCIDGGMVSYGSGPTWASQDFEVIGNFLNNYGTVGNGCTNGQGIYPANGGTSGAPTIIWNNLVMNITSYGIHFYHSPCNAYIANNTVLHNGDFGILIASGSGDTCSTDGVITLANNIADNNAGGPIRFGASGGGITCPSNTILVKNNLFNGNGNSNAIFGSGSCTQIVGSITAESSTTTFTNYQLNGSGTYTLKSGSLAIAGGTSSCVSGQSGCIPTATFTGAAQSSPPVIGAFLGPSPSIYYVDYVGGSDSNSGLTKVLAWQHAPGMTNCMSVCLSTTPLSGNSYVFKGGVTWTSSYPWTLTGGVNYTTDATWYTGGSFTRPTFDDGHADPGATGMINSSGAGFITLNDFDIVNCGTSGTANSDKCLVWENDHDITISNSVFATQSWIANYFVFDAAGSYSNFIFSGNDFSATSGAMWFASAQASTSEHNVKYLSNTFHDFTSQLGGGVHGDGAWHYFSVPASDATQYVDGVTFCDNRFYGDFRVSFSGGGGMTAFFFTEGSFSGTICNNDMSYTPAQANMFDALIDLSGNSNTKAKTVGIYNNSLAAIGTNAMSAAYDFSGMVSGDVITSENNIIFAPQYAIYLEDSATATAFASDYNLLNSSSGDMDVAGSFKSYAQWQGLGYDVHGSLGTDPSWTSAPGNETLQAGSPAIGAGLNLTSLGISFLTFDIAGIPRPSSAAWDIGAYQYASVPFGPVAPAPLGIASLQQ